MSAKEEEMAIQEYLDWRIEREENPVDVSLEAFMEQREALDNARRIEAALDVIVDADRGNPKGFWGTIEALRSILVDDRPSIDTTPLTGPPSREFT